jgi:hypothetical protein
MLDDQQAAVFSQVNGARSLRECLAAAGLPVEAAATTDLARSLFSTLWRSGYVMFRLPGKA